MVGNIFMGVYGVTIETIMQCYILDKKRIIDGSTDVDFENCHKSIRKILRKEKEKEASS